jgi:hypothetical protein
MCLSIFECVLFYLVMVADDLRYSDFALSFVGCVYSSPLCYGCVSYVMVWAIYCLVRLLVYELSLYTTAINFSLILASCLNLRFNLSSKVPDVPSFK